MLQFSRDGGPHTTPFFIYESAPMPLCGSLECNQGRGEPCRNGCEDERIAAQAGGARMGMAVQESSDFADLANTASEKMHRHVEWPARITIAVAVVALLAFCLTVA